MERSLTERWIAPVGWGKGGALGTDVVLGFDVFVAASDDDEALRRCVDAALAEINHRERAVKLRPLHFKRSAVIPTRGDAQEHTESSMGGPDRVQITVGILAARLGPWTKEEILKALAVPEPGPALFVFYPTAVVGAAGLAGDVEKLKQRVHEHEQIQSFVKQIERSGIQHSERRRCIPFEESAFQKVLWAQLDGYVRRWIEAAPVHAASRVSVTAAVSAPTRPLPSRPHYLGLKPYGPKDARYFFGRDLDVARLTEALKQPAVQTLHLKGGSGVGKSSLVLAGLMPRVAGGEELPHAIVFKPGADPFRSLARAVDERRPSTTQVEEQGWPALAARLESSDENFCAILASEMSNVPEAARRFLYIDQLEELLLEGIEADESQRRRRTFAARLCAFLSADARNTLVTSIRTDRDDLLGSPLWRVLGRRIAEGRQEWIYAPDVDEELPTIVEGPARLAGLDVEPALIKALRADAQDLPSWPPLLGAALDEIARRWEATPPAERQAVLTLEHYRAIGGLAAVLGKRTRTVMDSLTEEQRAKILPQLFPLLIRLDDRGRATKRRFLRTKFGVATAEGEVLDQLINRRLLVDEGEVEVAHDLLFEVWAELAAWIKGHADDLDVLSEIEHQAHRWMRRRENHELLSRDRLERAERALQVHPLRAQQMPEVEDFIRRSRLVRDQEALVSAIPRGAIDELLGLLKRDIRLDEKQLDDLKANQQLAFYYALFPTRIPKDGTGPRKSIAAGFKEAGDGDEAAARLQFFTPDNTSAHVSNNLTVQHYAVIAGRLEVLKRLHEIGADLMARTDRGSTPLALAAHNGRLEVLEWLVSLGPEQARLLTHPGRGLPLLHRAAACGSEPVIRYLLDHGANLDELDADGYSVLAHSLIDATSAKVAPLLIAAGAKIDAPEPNNPLMRAAVLGDRTLVELLLDKGADIERLDSGLWRSLGTAIAQDAPNIAVIRVLVERGADPNAVSGEDKWSPLSLAAERGQADIVVLLLKHGAAVNTTSGEGWTALMRAIFFGHEAVAELLARAPGLDLQKVGPQGTAVALAVDRGAWRLVRALIDVSPSPLTMLPPLLIQKVLTLPKGPRNSEQVAVAEQLVAAGAKLPPFKRWGRDETGAPVGLVPKPLAERRSWFEAHLAPSGGEAAETDQWSIAPLLRGAWTVLDTAAAAALLAQATETPALDEFPWADVSIGGVRTLPFPTYPAGRLVEISIRRNTEIGYLTLMDTAGDLNVFDGGSAPVHDLNDHVALALSTPHEAADYLRLFCGVVCGDEGTFLVFEHEEQLQPRDTMTPEQRATALAHRASLVFEFEARDDRQQRYFEFSANIHYGTALFKARFRLQSSGFIEMIDDEPLINDLQGRHQLFDTNKLRVLSKD